MLPCEAVFPRWCLLWCYWRGRLTSSEGKWCGGAFSYIGCYRTSTILVCLMATTSLSVPQIRDVQALSFYVVTKWKVAEGRTVSFGFAATSVISLGNGLSSGGVERWEIQRCQLPLHLLHHAHHSSPACHYSKKIRVRYLCGRGCGGISPCCSRPHTVKAQWPWSAGREEEAAALCIHICRWELMIDVSSLNSFSSAPERGTAVWILLGAHVWQTGDPSYKKMSEALGNSSSTVVPNRSALCTGQLDPDSLFCPWKNFTVALGNLNHLLLFWA